MLLAPVVRERKGEHAQVFEQLRAQGFVRVRVDGELYEIDAVPPLALRVEAHDRGGDRPLQGRARTSSSAWPNRSRPRSSSATAWRGAVARRRPRQHRCCSRRSTAARSATTRCPSSSRACSRSTRRSAPARPATASASAQFFDPARVVVHPELSLAAGAVRGWDRRNAYYFQLIPRWPSTTASTSTRRGRRCRRRSRAGRAVRQRRGADRPSATSPKPAAARQRKHRFEGIVPNLERRYRETESAAVREELAKYISERPCPDCGGARLNRSARNVFVADRAAAADRGAADRRGAGVLRAT